MLKTILKAYSSLTRKKQNEYYTNYYLSATGLHRMYYWKIQDTLICF